MSKVTGNPLSNAYCIALQPVCDRALHHVADELYYRESEQAAQAQFQDQAVASARVSQTAFYEMGLPRLVGERQVFFLTPIEWLNHPDYLPPFPEQVVLDIQADELNSLHIDYLNKALSQGYQLVLDYRVEVELLKSLSAIARIDALSGYDAQRVQQLEQEGIKLLAKRVESAECFSQLMDLGVCLFQGYFYAKPEVAALKPPERGGNQSAQLRILSLLQQEEPDYRQLEALIAQDPQLTVNLLRLCNSALFRRRSEVTSLYHALINLGLDRLRSIVATALLAGNGGASRLLLPQAMTRAAMCERAAEKMSALNPREAFMVGLLSMMEPLLNMPLSDLLDDLGLDSDIRAAVEKREGRLGQLLSLILAYEQAQSNGQMTERLMRLNPIWLESRSWVNQLLIELEG